MGKSGSMGLRMEAYLEVLDLWKVVKKDYEILPLLDNPIRPFC